MPANSPGMLSGAGMSRLGRMSGGGAVRIGLRCFGQRLVERVSCRIPVGRTPIDADSRRPTAAVAEHQLDVVVDLLGGGNHRDEVPAEEGADGVLREQVVGVGRGDHRSAEFPLDGDDVVVARQIGGQDRARGRVDPIGIEIDELKIALVRHVPDGLHVAHGWVIGRLRAHD